MLPVQGVPPVEGEAAAAAAAPADAAAWLACGGGVPEVGVAVWCSCGCAEGSALLMLWAPRWGAIADGAAITDVPLRDWCKGLQLEVASLLPPGTLRATPAVTHDVLPVPPAASRLRPVLDTALCACQTARSRFWSSCDKASLKRDQVGIEGGPAGAYLGKLLYFTSNPCECTESSCTSAARSKYILRMHTTCFGSRP